MKKIARVNIQVEPTLSNEISFVPEYAHEGDAGFDFRARIDEPVTLKPLERKLFKTGIKAEIPEGFEIQVRPRSGLALKHGLTVLNTPGTIDSEFRGEIGVILINLSSEEYTIQPGERIAQGVLKELVQADFRVGIIDLDTERGGGEYGSSGKF